MIYQDIYIEQAVSEKTRNHYNIYITLCVFGILVSLFFQMLVPGILFFLFVILFCVFIYVLSRRKKNDFDYVYCNHVFEIDRIIGKEKRKHLFSVDVETVEALVPAESGEAQPYLQMHLRTYKCTSRQKDAPYYVMVAQNQESGAKIRVLFEPNRELLEQFQRKCGITKVTIRK